MKKLYSLFLSILIALSLLVVGGRITVKAKTVEEYYATVSTKTGQDLARTLHDIIKEPKVTSYNGLFTAYRTTDCYPGTNTIWDMYSNEKYDVDKDSGSGYKKEGDCYNREHSVPQSWFSEASPMKSDAFHVYPTDGYVNNRRSSYVYGEVVDGKATYTSKNGSKLGPSAISSYSGTVFEPIDEYKGDFARTYFYMAICYSNRLGNWTKGEAQKVFKGSYPYLTNYSIELFTKWNNEDPVSEKEIARNEAVYAIQGNRNPFIDNPEWSTIIWGGTYNGGTTTTGYTVSYNVPKEASFSYVDYKKYEENSLITKPAAEPTQFGYKFDGWYKDSSFNTPWDFKSDIITQNITLYAKMSINDNMEEVFAVDTRMEVSLGINYSKELSGGSGITPIKKTTEFGFSGSYGSTTIQSGSYVDDVTHLVVAKNDTSYESDTFTFEYDGNGKNNIYIQNGETRLYYQTNGNGSKLVIRAKDGIKITEVKVGDDASGEHKVVISNDGKEAYIQASKNTSSGKFTFKNFTVKYESSDSSYTYDVHNVDLKIRYIISPEMYNLILKNKDYKCFMTIDNVTTECVIQIGRYAYEVYGIIHTTNFTQNHTITGSIVVNNQTYTTTTITRSVASIALDTLSVVEDNPLFSSLIPILYQLIPDTD